jgi:ribonuclease-3
MTKNNTSNISELEVIIGIKFNSQDLLLQSMVHRSYLNEHANFHLPHNERLEFLGDAVLELVVTDFLYKNYSEPEGELTNWRASLVNATMCATVATELQLEKFLLLSRGEAQDKNKKARNYILANAYESLVGAIYLDRGLETASDFIHKTIILKLPNIIENELYLDAKSKFQELSQEKYNITPTYKVLAESGPDHDKIFEVAVFIGEKKIASASGSSKQEAQMKAAQAGLQEKKWDKKGDC